MASSIAVPSPQRIQVDNSAFVYDHKDGSEASYQISVLIGSSCLIGLDANDISKHRRSAFSLLSNADVVNIVVFHGGARKGDVGGFRRIGRCK
jgi:hypothetical protein